MAFTYTDIADGETASSSRTKINTLGSNAAGLSTNVDTNTTDINTLTTNTTNAILQFTNKTVAVGDWVSNGTYTYYPYKANITCTGVTSAHTPFVMLSPSDQESGHYIGADTGVNTVAIYASTIPSSTLTIPNITAIKVVSSI